MPLQNLTFKIKFKKGMTQYKFLGQVKVEISTCCFDLYLYDIFVDLVLKVYTFFMQILPIVLISLGIDFKMKCLEMDGKQIKIQVW